MKIFNWNSLNKDDFSQKTCMTIGVFDGIHMGHKKLLEKVLEVSKANGYSSGVVTFSDSIFDMFKGNEKPLQTLEERYQRLSDMGFDFCILIDFTPEVAGTEGNVFLQTLTEQCNLSYLVEGEDFCLGKGGKTGMKEIKAFCQENNIETFFVSPVLFEGKRVSSTIIRSLIKTGNIEKANILMN